MKTRRALLSVAALMLGCVLRIDSTRAADPAEEVEKALREFYSALEARNVERLQSVLQPSLMTIEANQQNAITQVLDTSDAKKLLPPPGNDDWNNVKLSDIKVDISATQSVLATAAFTLELQLSEKDRASLRAALKENRPITADQRKAIEKAAAGGAWKLAMFATLAQTDGVWKIACLTFPK